MVFACLHASRTSNSPRKVLVTAWRVAIVVLPTYTHRFSPRKFTRHQLFACLVLKAFLKSDYRGLVAHLRDCPNLREAIELERVPHFMIIQKAARRLLRSNHVDALLAESVRRMMG